MSYKYHLNWRSESSQNNTEIVEFLKLAKSTLVRVHGWEIVILPQSTLVRVSLRVEISRKLLARMSVWIPM